jgi:hypothetical protein
MRVVEERAIGHAEEASNLQLKTLMRMVTALGGRLQVEVVPPSRAQGRAPRVAVPLRRRSRLG